MRVDEAFPTTTDRAGDSGCVAYGLGLEYHQKWVDYDLNLEPLLATSIKSY